MGLASHLEETRGTGFVLLNCCQMTKTEPHLSSFSFSFPHCLYRRAFDHDIGFGIRQAHMRGGAPVEWCFEPGALRLEIRDFTIRPLHPFLDK
ncbi:hypothetical protein AVEN_58404-1 [Araneus ventricosus]|uniref:Uncharacterized protein n=1 Tax=Araneus ventricosus TaxID=182803 RepID=A0A4Y2F2G0_ARAVE|nr:hypothetical protein AVEN_58404-1 [Araneus ventricosus]